MKLRLNRRQMLAAAGTTLLSVSPLGRLAHAAAAANVAAPAPNLLILIELRGGNDALNTVLPDDEARYRELRPRLALPEETRLQLASGLTVHAALAPLRSAWDAGELAVLRGIGYPQPNLSHFRSIEIWDTASDADQILQRGWLTRVVAGAQARFAAFSADGVVIGAPDLGPLGGGARAVAMNDPARFARTARLAHAADVQAVGPMAHLLRVEADALRAGSEIQPDMKLPVEFPRTGFGQAARQAAALAVTRRVAVMRLALGGFDTHQNQLPLHAALLGQLAEGIAALRAALIATGLWQQTLIATYSEFGRRPKENGTAGSDHGSAGVHFVLGGRVRGAVLGDPLALDRLDAAGNPPHSIDFRTLYASVLEDWWQIDSLPVLGQRFRPLPLLRA
jgi:uncharacterized protein (DUF1501 family)